MSEISLEPSELEIEHAFEMLIPKIQALLTDHYQTHYISLTAPTIRVEKGRKYWKLISVAPHRTGDSSTVYAFIRRSDGAILRPASWKSPELRVKNPVHGYITDDHCLEWFSSAGVRYAAY
jgi:hypothetical protein